MASVWCILLSPVPAYAPVDHQISQMVRLRALLMNRLLQPESSKRCQSSLSGAIKTMT